MQDMNYLYKGKSCMRLILSFFVLGAWQLVSFVLSLWLTLPREIDALDQTDLEPNIPTEGLERDVKPSFTFRPCSYKLVTVNVETNRSDMTSRLETAHSP